MKSFKTLTLVVGMTLAGSVAFGQTERVAAATPTQGCVDGRCRLVPGLPISPVRAEWRVEPSLNALQREMIARAGGFVRLKAMAGEGGLRLGSAVCVGQGPTVGTWVFLSAGHIFAGEAVTRVELDVRGEWRLAEVVVGERSPDRAVLLMECAEVLRSPAVSQEEVADGPGVMVGFPGGGEAKAFTGRVGASEGATAWLMLDRTSHFDCINGASGGGVYDAAGELIGIQSCTDGRGYVGAVGFTPVGAWDEVFARLGWCPTGWGRGCASESEGSRREQARRPDEGNIHNDVIDNEEQKNIDSRLERVEHGLDEVKRMLAAIEQGSQGEQGPAGERGPVGPAGASVSEAELTRAVAAYLAAYPVERIGVGPLEERLQALEERMDVPFEVQLFDSGTKVGGSRFVRPHGGYLPLDVFGDVENVAGPSKGE